MTISPIVRARLLGSLLVALAFVAGVMTGLALDRRPRAGLNVMVTATASDRMPRELERLDLTPAQQGQIRTILLRGRDRIFEVTREFKPRIQAVMDSTNGEIDGVLTPAQRASLSTYRREHPAFVDQEVIKKRE